jgi:hypothetical protein
MRCNIDLGYEKDKQKQVTLIFEGLLEQGYTSEAKMYSIIFAKMKKIPIKYEEVKQAYIELNEEPITEVQYKRIMKNLTKVKIQFVDDKHKRRNVSLITEE